MKRSYGSDEPKEYPRQIAYDERPIPLFQKGAVCDPDAAVDHRDNRQQHRSRMARKVETDLVNVGNVHQYRHQRSDPSYLVDGSLVYPQSITRLYQKQ